MSWEKKKLGDFIEKVHLKGENWQGSQTLEPLGVSNVDGITKTSHKKSQNLSNYIVIQPDYFAYNPYRINVGSIGLTPENVFGLVSPAYTVFKAKEGKLMPELLLDFLKSDQGLHEINKHARGTVRKALRYEDLCAIEMVIPSYSEQLELYEKKKILDQKISLLSDEIQTQKTLLSKLKQSILKEAIQGKLTQEWRKKNSNVEPSSELLKRIKAEKEQLIKDKKIKKEKPLPTIDEEEIPFELPKGWVWCRMQEVTRLITDGKHGNCVDEINSGYYFLSAKDIQEGELLYKNSRQINFKEFQEVHNRTNLEPGDLCVVNTGGTVGKTAIVKENEFTRKTTFQKSVAIVKPVHKVILTEYLNMFIIVETPNLLKTSRGSAINNLLLGDMKKICIPIPPILEQEVIVNRAKDFLEKRRIIQSEIFKCEYDTKILRQSVLKEAFERKLEVEI